MLNVTEKSTVYNAFFRMDGYALGNFRGIGRVVIEQNNVLRSLGVLPVTLTGETDSLDPKRDGVVILPSMRDDSLSIFTKSQARTAITEVTNGATILFHNTTKPKNNLAYCQAAANLVDEGVHGYRNPAVLWAHDFVKTSSGKYIEEVRSTFPSSKGARIAVVSNTRIQQMKHILSAFHILGMPVPDYDIRLIPNPIETQFLQPVTTDIPNSFGALVPFFSGFTEAHHLPQTPEIAEKVIFGDKYKKFILSGSVAHNKSVLEAIDAVEAYGNAYQPAALIITNQIDLRTPANRDYYDKLLTRLKNISTASQRNFEVLILGGIERKYMRWLYEQCDMQLAPFQNEGFSLAPSEAALSGIASAFAEDPAMLETTDGNGLVLPLTEWRQPLVVAGSIDRYLGTPEQVAHVAALSAKAHALFHPDVVGKQLVDIITP